VRAAEGILSTLDDGAWRIQIHRASKRNALTMTMFSALAESLGLAQSNDAVRAITLSGLGPNFCAGHDLSAFDSWPQGAGDPVPRFLHALAERLDTCHALTNPCLSGQLPRILAGAG